ncbi:hypothetical protein LCGC14_1377620 [marine sediment metagenome]|uniref:Uncharacterized protein n=1 Tax=marine sediment metagenome TaxID=412755 RepID=A0A0F9K3L7_9ZZZZ
MEAPGVRALFPVSPLAWWLMGRALPYWLPTTFLHMGTYRPEQVAIVVRYRGEPTMRVRWARLLRAAIRSEARQRSIRRFGAGHYVGEDGW